MDYLTGRWDGIDENKLADSVIENQEMINEAIEFYKSQKEQEERFMRILMQGNKKKNE